MLKKIFISLLLTVQLFAFVAIPFAKTAKAQTDPSDMWPWYTPGFWAFGEKVYDTSNPDEIFGERYTAAQVKWIFYSLVQQMLHDVFPDSFYCILQNRGKLFDDTTTVMLCDLFADNSTTNLAVNEEQSLKYLSTKYFVNNPLSGIGYLVKKTQNFGLNINLIEETKAQSPGFGYASVKKGLILQMWTATRDISYFMSVLVIIVMAFMIMFRTKISPQAVITVQSALPKIIIGLVLVTFSFAISGLLIDLTYVLIGLITTLIYNSGLIDTNGMFGLGSTKWSDLFSLFVDGPKNMGVLGLLDYYWQMFIPAFLGVIGRVLTSGVGGFVLGLLGGVLSPVILLLILFVLLIAGFKVFFTMIKIYMGIVLSIMAGPLYILAGIISPSMGVGAWIKSLMSNLLAYPVVAVLFFVALVFEAAAMGPLFGTIQNFLSQIQNLFGSTNIIFNGDVLMSGIGWIPPLTVGGGDLLPLLYLFVSLSIILLIPKVAEIIKSAITGKPFAYGSAIGEGLAVGYALGKSGVGGTLGSLGNGQLPFGLNVLRNPTILGTSNPFAKRIDNFAKSFNATGKWANWGTRFQNWNAAGQRKKWW